MSPGGIPIYTKSAIDNKFRSILLLMLAQLVASVLILAALIAHVVLS